MIWWVGKIWWVGWIIGCSYHFVINHGCHIDKIKAMKTNTLHLVNISLFISHMFVNI
jgi:hypothetical protein